MRDGRRVTAASDPLGEIVGFAEDAVPIALRRQVLALQDEAWPPTDGSPSTGLVHDPALDPWSLLLVCGDEVVAACDVLSATLRHAGRSWRASGLSTVVTAPAARRQGHALRLVRAAIDAAFDRGAEIALFTCDPPLAGLYVRAGCRVLDGAVLIGGTRDDPLRSDSLGKTVLARFPPAHAAAATAFEHCEIALHPGPIDRLW